jgi:hypothetical protein
MTRYSQGATARDGSEVEIAHIERGNVMTKRAYFYAWGLMIILIIVAAAPVMAAPVLLTEFPSRINCGGGGISYTEFTAVSFALVYGDTFFPFGLVWAVSC